jgi:hypothetical protein
MSKAFFKKHFGLGGCPRIESLLRKSGFRPLFPIKFVQYSKYSPHLIETMTSKPLSLATASMLEQPPGSITIFSYFNYSDCSCA